MLQEITAAPFKHWIAASEAYSRLQARLALQGSNRRPSALLVLLDMFVWTTGYYQVAQGEEWQLSLRLTFSSPEPVSDGNHPNDAVLLLVLATSTVSGGVWSKPGIGRGHAN